MSLSDVDNRSLTIAGALLLVIGFAGGALTMAIMRPPVHIEQAGGQAPIAVQVAQPQPAAKAPLNAAPQQKVEPILADTNDVPDELVAFIRERLAKNTESGQWEEIEWVHHVGEKEDQRISNLWLPVKVGGHGAMLHFRSFNGNAWHKGWIAAAQYGPDHFDWCGIFDGAIVNPAFTMPSDKPIIRNDIEKAFQMMDEVIDEYDKTHPRPAPHRSPSAQSTNP